MKEKRSYVMHARAQQAAATRRRILEAAVEQLAQRRVSEVRLEDIAARAEVTVQTVLRVFTSRDRLVEEAWDATRDRILASRESAIPGDIPGTIAALFDHYEQMGDFVIRNLADERQLPEMKGWLERGRKAHRQSMQHQFEPWLRKCSSSDQRRALTDCLVAACDVYVWKLFRRDLGRSRSEAEARICQMVSAILKGQGGQSSWRTSHS